MEQKIAHLGFIQGVITRLGNNSFMIKGWCIALVAALFALSSSYRVAVISFLAILIFWCLDAFFLHQERMYIKLYEDVASGVVKSDHFLMKATDYKVKVGSLCKAGRSKTLLPFYLGMILIILLLVCGQSLLA